MFVMHKRGKVTYSDQQTIEKYPRECKPRYRNNMIATGFISLKWSTYRNPKTPEGEPRSGPVGFCSAK